MCKTLREITLQQIANSNNTILDNIIVFINNNLNIDLYRESNNIKSSNDIKKIKAFYKQTVKRLLSLIERHSMKERLLLEDIEKGQRILDMKKSATVQSPSYGSEAGKQENGYHPNTQEKILIAIEEEWKRQTKRIEKHEVFVEQFENEKALIQSFIELSPYTTNAEVGVRHYVLGERFCKIEDKLCHSNVRTAIGRLIDDLGMILMYAL